MKKIFIYIVIILSIFGLKNIYAETWDTIQNNDSTINSQICKSSDFELFWADKIKAWSSQEYSIKSKIKNNFSEINYELYRDWELIESIKWEKYLRYFTKPWIVKLIANIKLANWCEIKLNKDIKIYKTQYTYIWADLNYFKNDIYNIFENKYILLNEVSLWEESTLIKINDSISETLYNNIDSIKNSDVLIIKTNDPSLIFWILLKMSSNTNINFSFAQKKIYIVSNIWKSLAEKLLAQNIKLLWVQNVYLLNNNLLLNLVITLWENKFVLNDNNFNQISYKKQSWFYSLNMLSYHMIYWWFPVFILGFLLSLSIAILFINFFKQIVWIYSFWIYNPIFLAITFSMISFKLVIILMMLAFLSTYIVNNLIKKIYLLYSAKRSLLITLYFILTIIFFGIDNYFEFNLIDNSAFSNIFLIFPFLFLILIADQIFHEDINIFSRSWFILFFQFIMISWISYYIINSVVIQNLLLSYPDFLIVILLLNIVIWRYTWLQFFEYIRFFSLLKNIDQEE